MEMTLLLLFFGAFWAQEVNSQSLELSTPINSPFPLIPNISEVPNLNSMSSNYTTMRIPEKNDSTGHRIIPPSSTPDTANEVSSSETSITANSGLSIAEPVTSHAISTEKPSMSQETSNGTSNPTPPAMSTLGFHIMTGGTMAATNLETSNGTSGPSVTMTTSSQEVSNGTSGPSVTMTTSSQEVSNGTSGLPVTMTTSSLETSNGTSEPLVTMATSSQESSSGTSGLPFTMATSSLETPKGTSGSSPISGVKVSVMTTPKTSTNTGSGPSSISDQRTNNTLLLAVLMALLVGIVLLALLLLWRQRQKRRTGALTLSRGGKRNGVVDAWAGPARVSDEEAMITTAGVSGGDKGSGIPEGDGSGRRPTLTTFFGRRKSRQGSLALEELKAGSAASLKEGEEPLVDNENGALEAPASDRLEAEDVEVP